MDGNVDGVSTELGAVGKEKVGKVNESSSHMLKALCHYHENGSSGSWFGFGFLRPSSLVLLL